MNISEAIILLVFTAGLSSVILTCISLSSFVGHLVRESSKRRAQRALIKALTKEKYNDPDKSA